MYNPELMKTPLWKKALRWLPYAAIIVAVALAVHALSQYSTISRLEKRLEAVESRNIEMQLEAIKKLVVEMEKIEGKVTEGKEESKVIKVDIGKTIKEFNRDVKATKEISTAADSVAALHNAWSK